MSDGGGLGWGRSEGGAPAFMRKPPRTRALQQRSARQVPGQLTDNRLWAPGRIGATVSAGRSTFVPHSFVSKLLFWIELVYYNGHGKLSIMSLQTVTAPPTLGGIFNIIEQSFGGVAERDGCMQLAPPAYALALGW